MRQLNLLDEPDGLDAAGDAQQRARDDRRAATSADVLGHSHQPVLIFEDSDVLRLLGGTGSSNKSLAR